MADFPNIRDVNLKDLSPQLLNRLNYMIAQGVNPIGAQKEIVTSAERFQESQQNIMSLRGSYRDVTERTKGDLSGLDPKKLSGLAKDLKTSASERGIDLNIGDSVEEVKKAVEEYKKNLSGLIEEAKNSNKKAASNFNKVASENAGMMDVLKKGQEDLHIEKIKKEVAQKSDLDVSKEAAALQGTTVFNEEFQKRSIEQNRKSVIDEQVRIAHRDRVDTTLNAADMSAQTRDDMGLTGEPLRQEAQKRRDEGSITQTEYQASQQEGATGETISQSGTDSMLGAYLGSRAGSSSRKQAEAASGESGTAGGGTGNSVGGGLSGPGGVGGEGGSGSTGGTAGGEGPGATGTGGTGSERISPWKNPFQYASHSLNSRSPHGLDPHQLMFMSDFGKNLLGDSGGTVMGAGRGLVSGAGRLGLLAGGPVGIGLAAATTVAATGYDQYADFAKSQQNQEALTGENLTAGGGDFMKARFDGDSLMNQQMMARIRNINLSGQEIQGLSDKIMGLGGSTKETAATIGKAADTMANYRFLSQDTIAKVSLEAQRNGVTTNMGNVLGQTVSDITSKTGISGQAVAQNIDTAIQANPYSPAQSAMTGAAVSKYEAQGTKSTDAYFSARPEAAKNLMALANTASGDMSLQMFYNLPKHADMSTNKGQMQNVDAIMKVAIPKMDQQNLRKGMKDGKMQVIPDNKNISDVKNYVLPQLLGMGTDNNAATDLIEQYNAQLTGGQTPGQVGKSTRKDFAKNTGKENFKEGDSPGFFRTLNKLAGDNFTETPRAAQDKLRKEDAQKMKGTSGEDLLSHKRFDPKEGKVPFSDMTLGEKIGSMFRSGLSHPDQREKSVFNARMTQGNVKRDSMMEVTGPGGKTRSMAAGDVVKALDSGNAKIGKDGQPTIKDWNKVNDHNKNNVGSGSTQIEFTGKAKDFFKVKGPEDKSSFNGQAARSQKQSDINRGKAELNSMYGYGN